MPPRNPNDLTLEEIAKLRRREARQQAASGSSAGGPMGGAPGAASGRSFGRFDSPPGGPGNAPSGSGNTYGAGTLGSMAGAAATGAAYGSGTLGSMAGAANTPPHGGNGGLTAAIQAANHAPAVSSASRPDKWYFEPQSDDDGDAWLMTYLDTITLLLVFLLIMLMLAGKGDGVNVRESIQLGNLGIFSRSRTTPPPPAPPTAGNVPIPSPSGGSTPIPLQPSADDGTTTDPLQGLELGDLGSDIDVVVNEKSVSFRINSEILFSSGQAELSREGLAVLQKLVNVVKQSAHTITIEGHTDSIPIRSARFPSNWELSSSRAGSVVRYFEANGIASTRLRAVGYADTKPLAPNDTPENRAQNRRVELLMETAE
ncbi:MAG: OmpA family protein [Pusillimonas sp.]